MNYASLIKETAAELNLLEKKQSLAIDRDRIRFLKVLKTQQVAGQTQAGEAIGLGQRQVQRLWRLYRQKGLSGLISTPNRRGWGKISCQQISHLRQFLYDDQAQTLAHIQACLAGSLGLTYSISGVSNLCQRLKIKPKTGRPVNVRQKPGAVDEFKKKFATLRADYPDDAILFHDELRAGTRTELGRNRVAGAMDTDGLSAGRTSQSWLRKRVFISHGRPR